MITESQIYWITRYDAINTVLSVLTVSLAVGVIFLSVGFVIYPIAEQQAYNKSEVKMPSLYYQVFICFILALIVSSLLWIFIPTTKEAALIKIIPSLANSEMAQKKLPKEMEEIYELTKSALKNSQRIKR